MDDHLQLSNYRQYRYNNEYPMQIIDITDSDIKVDRSRS